MKKRVLAILLCLTLLLGLIPVGVVAESTEPEVGTHTDHEGWTAWGDDESEQGTLPSVSGQYYLSEDIALEAAASVASAQQITLCLNGNTVDCTQSGRAYRLCKGAQLTICDCSAATTQDGTYIAGRITGATNTAIMIGTETPGATLNICDGIFMDNSISGSGSVIVAQGGSTVNIYGGEFSNNSATKNAGAIYANTTTINLYGGTLMGNSAGSAGGSIYASSANINLAGGLICENTAAHGAGLFVQNKCGIVLNGVTMTGNTATVRGAGIDYTGTGTLTVGGTTCIAGNKVGEQENNLVLVNGRKLQLDETMPLDSGAEIGISVCTWLDNKADYTLSGTVTFGSNATQEDAAQYFTSDVTGTEHYVQVKNGSLRFALPKKEHPVENYHDSGEWTEWTSATSLPTTSGYYYLAGDVDVTATNGVAVNSEQTIVLCLNGYTVTGKDRIYRLSKGANVTICDCTAYYNDDGELVTGKLVPGTAEGGAVNLVADGTTVETTLTLKDIIIDGSGKTGKNGGAVSLGCAGAVVQIEDCVIRNCTVTGKGGAIQNHSGTLTVTDTVFTGNTANYGGAMILLNASKTTLNNVTITDNTAKVYGGGIDNELATSGTGYLKLEGNTVIQDNRNTKANKVSNINLLNQSRCVVIGELGEDALIGITAEASANSQDLGAVTVSQSATEAALQHFVSDMDHEVYLEDGKLKIRVRQHTDHATDECGHSNVSWTATNALPTAAGHYYLTGNVTVTPATGFVYNSGAEVTICLNGYSIIGAGSGRLFRISNGTKLSICDCTGHGKLTGGNNATGGVAWIGKDASDSAGGTLNLYGGIVTGNTTGSASALIVIPNGTFNMAGGEISGNEYRAVLLENGAFNLSGGKITGNVYGGQDGVALRMKNGTFTMTGGEITGNENTSFGGIIRIDKGTATLSGGKISDNAAKSASGLQVTGGTVSLEGVEISGNTTSGTGAGLYVMNTATVTVGPGTVISDNTANGTGGAGVYITGTANVTLDGAVITGNTAGKLGGGVYHTSTGTLTVGGATQITGNTANGKTSNLHLADGKTFALQTLTDGAAIGVSADLTRVFTDGQLLIGTNAVQENVASYFTSDQDQIIEQKGDELYLVQDPDSVHTDHATDECGHESVTWNFWADSTTLPTAAGHYYLVGDVTLGATNGIAYNSGEEITICLNGYTISGAGTGRIFRMSNGTTVNLCDCSGHGQITNTSNAKAGIAWIGMDAGDSTGGNLNIYGGTFTGNVAGDDGALVYVDNGSFNLYGGAFIGNDSRILYLKQGTLGIHGGKITGNTFGRRDGSILRMTGGELRMTGGEISGNDNGSSSGMLRVDSGTATLTGGEISGNTSSGGTGMVVAGGTVVLKGVAIANNKSKLSGAGLYIMKESTVTVGSGTRISGNSSGKWGGGIYVTDSKLNINGGSITGNRSVAEGAGFYASNSTVTMRGGSISYNTTQGNGAGVCNRGEKGVFYLYGGSISHNQALNTKSGTGHAGGVLIQGKGSFYMYGGTISNNAATSQGGGVRLTAKSGFGLYGGTISGNTAYRGAGVYTETDFTLEDCVITNNTAANEGGGLYISDCKMTMNSGIISNNCIADADKDDIPDGSSGGLTVRLRAECIMNGGEITGNIGKHAGGVVVQSEGVFTLNDGLIANNKAQGGYGGGLYNSRSTVYLLGGTFRENVSTHAGGALFTDGTFIANGCEFIGNSVTAVSGGICSGGAIKTGQKASVTLENCKFVENTVMGRGGALDVSYKATAVIKGCTFTGNTASANGGAIGIYTVGKLDVTDTVFNGNSAIGYGGVVYSEPVAEMNFTNTTFENNKAGTGGAVYVAVAAQANFTNCTATGNTGNRYGSAIYANGGVSLTDTVVTGNQGKAHAVTLDATGSDGESFLTGVNQFKGNVTISDNAGGGLELLEGAFVNIHGDGLSEDSQILLTQAQGGITKQIFGPYDYVREGDVYTLTKGELALSQADPLTVEDETTDEQTPQAPEETPNNAKQVVLIVFGSLLAVAAVLTVIAILAVKKMKKRNAAK